MLRTHACTKTYLSKPPAPSSFMQVPEQFRQATIDKLSVALPLSITAGLLDDNNYWKRAYEVVISSF